MTPKEKAKELVRKMRAGNRLVNAAKRCAIIAVDEAILYHPLSTFPDEREIEFHSFWKHVKEEINKL